MINDVIGMILEYEIPYMLDIDIIDQTKQQLEEILKDKINFVN
jgi:hypothetical protein